VIAIKFKDGVIVAADNLGSSQLSLLSQGDTADNPSSQHRTAL
jgi:20S proteasome alpha/beta subunit